MYVELSASSQRLPNIFKLGFGGLMPVSAMTFEKSWHQEWIGDRHHLSKLVSGDIAMLETKTQGSIYSQNQAEMATSNVKVG